MDWVLRMVWGGANGLRSVGGANFVVLDHTLVVVAADLSSSAEDDGGGRSPYKPPSIITALRLVNDFSTNWTTLRYQRPTYQRYLEVDFITKLPLGNLTAHRGNYTMGRRRERSKPTRHRFEFGLISFLSIWIPARV